MKKYKVSTPGSLMLMGEHAVLNGSHALVASIDKRLFVTLTPLKEKIIRIISSQGTIEFPLLEIPKEENLKFVLKAIETFKDDIQDGFELNYESELETTLGFGSSAAVSVASVAVLLFFLKEEKSLDLIYKLSMLIIKSIQKQGSGSDIAASVFGGTLCYKPRPFYLEKLKYVPSIVVMYSGYKTPTTEVINYVKELEEKDPGLYENLYNLTNQVVLKSRNAINDKNWHQLGFYFNIAQGLMDSFGVSDQKLSSMVCQLKKEPNIFGAKISGSGLGDCVIGLGKINNKKFKIEDVTLSSDGIIYHE